VVFLIILSVFGPLGEFDKTQHNFIFLLTAVYAALKVLTLNFMILGFIF